jgi:hypothetical protein
MQLPPSISSHIENGLIALNNVKQNNKYVYSKYDLQCGEFPEPNWVKGEPVPSYIDNILKKLPSKERPALYYFEILAGIDNKEILAKYRGMKSDIKIGRASAVLKKEPPTMTSTLYVGKVKGDMLGRAKVHFGYYHNCNTSGLQLVCWAKKISLKLRLHIYSFDQAMAPYVGALELPFSRSLNPMIGKQ